MIEYADVIVDLQAGDTGKGKVAHHLLREGSYDFVLRYNGGGNAGHTIYHNGTKIVTHQIPAGVLFGVKSIIGPGCVVDFQKLREEAKMLESHGFNVRDNLLVDKRAHVTLLSHISEDSRDTKIGTTKQGIGPTYVDKYGRKGVRAGDIIKYNGSDTPFQIVDVIRLFHAHTRGVRILGEGAQGFQLDIDYGDYPYVTTSHCTVGSFCMNGVPPDTIREVYGTAKAYETYSGFKEGYEPEGFREIITKIREVGCEYGATTGRPRQIRWIDIQSLIDAACLNGVSTLIINKIDVLEELNFFPIMDGDMFIKATVDQFKNYVERCVMQNTPVKNIIWSTKKEGL